MKKIVGIMAAAALATSAFAVDVAATARAKALFASDGYGWEDENIGTDDMLKVEASTDVAGSSIGIRAKGITKDVVVDSYNVWIKPVEQVKITMASGADFSIFGDGVGKGDAKIGILNEGSGFKGELTPVDGLWIGARVGAPAKHFIGDVDKNLSWAAGLSYTVEGVGKFGGEFAREGAAGESHDYEFPDGTKLSDVTDYLWNGFMVGADITAVENLDVKLDFAAWLFNDDVVDAKAYKAGVFATYTADALTLKASDRVIIRSGDAYDYDDAEKIANIVCAAASYSVGAFTPSVSFAVASNNAVSDCYKAKVNSAFDASKATDMGITVGCDYKVGSATVSVEYSYNYEKIDGFDSTDNWSLPITFKYAF